MKSNTLASSAIALGLFAVAGSQVFSSIAERQPAPVADVQPVAAVERGSMNGPGEPFIVWYDTFNGLSNNETRSLILVRAWSNGLIEGRNFRADQYLDPFNGCEDVQGPVCSSPWFIISSPQEGFPAISDANGDESVDLADLNLLLANFGPAPRNDIPESPCPFGLIPG